MTEPTSRSAPETGPEPAAGHAPDTGSEAAADRTYEVRINGSVPAGEVAEELLAELGEVEVTGHDVTTVLSGWFPDEQALAEFLRRLRAYGLEVVEIRRVAEQDPGVPPEEAP
jgi:hypothetical protein